MTTSQGTVDLGVEQTQQYSVAVGQGLSPDIIAQLYEVAKDADPHEWYQRHEEESYKYVYEMLDKEGWRKVALPAAEKWIASEENIERVERSVNRTRIPETPLRRGYCLLRLKEQPRPRWHSLPEGHAVDEHEPQSVVFVALTDLGPENGFFMRLEKGGDVCIDSKAQVQFPPTGGGLALFIALNL